MTRQPLPSSYHEHCFGVLFGVFSLNWAKGNIKRKHRGMKSIENYIILLQWHIPSFYWIVCSRSIWFDLIWFVSNSSTMLNCDPWHRQFVFDQQPLIAWWRHHLLQNKPNRGQHRLHPTEFTEMQKIEDLCWWSRWFIHSFRSFISTGFRRWCLTCPHICLLPGSLLMQNLWMWIKMVSEIADAISDHLIDNNAWLLLNIIYNNEGLATVQGQCTVAIRRSTILQHNTSLFVWWQFAVAWGVNRVDDSMGYAK